jgi:arylsulfatase
MGKRERTHGSPNVVHFFVDQMRFDCIGAFGAVPIRTPALDRLVNRGVAFENAFSPCPVCIPARCSMIHGQYPHHTGCYENGVMPSDGRHSFMDTLGRHGYRTHGVGKCHFTPDPLALRGFPSRETQEEIPLNPESDDYLTYLRAHGFEHVIDPHGARGPMYYIPQVSQMPAHLHPTQWVGDRSVGFIRDAASRDEPWYLFSSFVHPHPPFAPPAPWYKMYGIDDVPLPHIPAGSDQLLTYTNRAQNRYKYRDQGSDLNLVRMIRAYYYASISFIDYQVGRVMAELESLGLVDNTLVIFTGDHGEYLGDYGSFGKRGMHDVSARVPFVAAMPGVFDGGKLVRQPVSLVDIAPTILEAVGADHTRTGTHQLDGIPLQTVVSGSAERTTVFSQISFTPDVDGTNPNAAFHGDSPVPSDDVRAAHSTYMAVNEGLKYVYSATDDREFLFDRKSDPHETGNRAHAPGYRSKLEEMRGVLIKHLVAGGETAGIDGTGWRRFPPKQLSTDPDYGLLVQEQPWADITVPGYTG